MPCCAQGGSAGLSRHGPAAALLPLSTELSPWRTEPFLLPVPPWRRLFFQGEKPGWEQAGHVQPLEVTLEAAWAEQSRELQHLERDCEWGYAEGV